MNALSRIYPDFLSTFKLDNKLISSKSPFWNKENWKEAAAKILTDRAKFSRAAIDYYRTTLPDAFVDDVFPLLRKKSWLLPHPIDINEVHLLTELEGYWDDKEHLFIATNEGLERYSSIVSEVISKKEGFSKKIFEDWDCYRFVDFNVIKQHPDTWNVELKFGLTTFFRMFDDFEVLGAELAIQLERLNASDLNFDLPIRTSIFDVFNLKNRSAVAGINCLLVFKNYRPPKTSQARQPVFFVHERRGGSAVQANSRHVVPAGSFQPFSSGGGTRDLDFDLSRCIARELFEELFGLDAMRTPTADLRDPIEEPPYSQAWAVLQDKSVTSIKFLGIGLDPLTTKPELLFSIVTDWQALVENSDLELRPNSEGMLRIVEFSQENLRMYAEEPAMLPAGSAIFSLFSEQFHLLAPKIATGDYL
jgi:hypothetical protein